MRNPYWIFGALLVRRIIWHLFTYPSEVCLRTGKKLGKKRRVQLPGAATQRLLSSRRERGKCRKNNIL